MRTRDKGAGEYTSASARKSARCSTDHRGRPRFPLPRLLLLRLGLGSRSFLCLAQNSSTAAHTHVSSARSHAPRRADLVCHWEDSDAVAQEVFANVRTPTSRLDCKGHAADLALPSALGLYHLHLRRVRGSDNIIPLHRDVPAGPWPDPRRRGKDCSSEIPSHDMAFARNAPETPETACEPGAAPAGPSTRLIPCTIVNDADHAIRATHSELAPYTYVGLCKRRLGCSRCHTCDSL